MGNRKKTQIKFILLIGLILLLLVALLRREDQGARIRTNEKEINKIEKQLDKRFDKLEEEINKLKISKKAKSTPTQVAATQPQPPQKPAVTYNIPDNVIVQAIYAKFGNRPQIVQLAVCESGLQPTVVSPYGDVGVFQVNAASHPQYPMDQLLNYQGNIQAAWEISNGGTNWGPWPNCAKVANLL